MHVSIRVSGVNLTLLLLQECLLKLHRRSLVVFWNDIQDSKCVLLMEVYNNFIKHIFCLITCSYMYITL